MTLDAGPLVRLDHGDEAILAWFKVAEQRGTVLRTPAVVVAEVWRGGARGARLARALNGLEVVDVDRRLAQEAGVLLAAATPSQRRLLAIDAIVVALAARRHDLVLTTDPDDVRPFADPLGVTVLTP